MHGEHVNRTAVRLTKILAVPVVLASAATAAGCAPDVTAKHYAPSDGIDVTVGDVKGNNLLLLTDAEGDPGRLIGAFYNGADQATTVDVAPQGTDPASIDVDASSSVYLGTAAHQKDVVFDETNAAPGTFLPVSVTVGGKTTTVQVPVLDGTLPEYTSLVPTASPTDAG
jgi:hypothetical protein